MGMRRTARRKGRGHRCARAMAVAIALCLLTACHPANQIEHLEEAVNEMRYCQRVADNMTFYACWLHAQRHIGRIEEEKETLTPTDRRRYEWARDEFYLISVTYHHAMGHMDVAMEDLATIDGAAMLQRDSVQWLHYRYLTDLAARSDERLLAAEASVLATYGDSAYWLTEARIYKAATLNREQRYTEALDTLQLAYDCISDDHVPECLCRISEQVSLAYAGLNMKDSSDIYRNIYLDMLETIRENKELEFRRQRLDAQSERFEVLSRVFMGLLIGFALALVALAVTASVRHRRSTAALAEQYDDKVEQFHDELGLHADRLKQNKRDNVVRKASLSIVTNIIPYIDRARHEVVRLQAMPDMAADDRRETCAYISELTDHINELNDILALWIQTRRGVVGLHIESFAVQDLFDIVAKRRRSFADQHLTLTVDETTATVRADRALTLFMLNTLTDNARKFTPAEGCVTLRAEEHDDYVELSVEDTGIGLSEEDVAQILGSKVYDASQIGDPDTAKGSGFGLMNCKGIIEKYRKTDSLFDVCRFGIDSHQGQGSRFWFRLPRVVRKALVVMVLGLFVGCNGPKLETLPISSSKGGSSDSLISSSASQKVLPVREDLGGSLSLASAFADSVYYANVEGRYEDAFFYGDSALYYLNRHCAEHALMTLEPLTLTGQHGGDVETQWWMSDFETDYATLLDVRNELAVAALAMHRIDDYRFNNRAYNELFLLMGEDRTLAAYCERQEKARTDMVTMLALCLVLLSALALLWWLFVIRPNKATRRLLEERNRELETLHEEDYDMRRTIHEENRLHVQNMVLDNCLSTIKHETSYYPGAIHQIADRLLHDDATQVQKQVDDMAELAAFYRDIFGTLASCADRQLEDVTFHRTTASCRELLERAADFYRRKAAGTNPQAPALTIADDGSEVECDVVLLDYLLENLIEASIGQGTVGAPLSLTADRMGDFVRFRFVDGNVTLTKEELRGLFYPSAQRMQPTTMGTLSGAEYLICRQIVREHDEYFGHVGCRIQAEQATDDGGLAIWFTIPAKR